MLTHTLLPRFVDADGLGHINHANLLSWTEEARRPIFKWFIPDLSPSKWNLIIARVEIDYLAQINHSDEVTIETEVEKVGRSSVTLVHRANQNNILCAQSKCIMVHFDYQLNKSKEIPDKIRALLLEHLMTDA